MRTARAAVAAALLALLPLLASASGVFELQVLEFSNSAARLASGACCGGGAAREGGGGEAACAAAAPPCRTRFALCLKEYQAQAQGGGAGGCSFGRAASPVLGTNSFTQQHPLYTLALNFTFRWTRSFTLILQAYDEYAYSESGSAESGLILETWWSGIVEPGAEWHALRGAADTGGAAVAYRVRVQCGTNYYNTTCTRFCRARDDSFGHYTCSAHGDKLCRAGWRGDNCVTPICKEGCHPVHGKCDKPGDCDCRPGWRGELCAACTPYPGCKHGYCNGSSWDCTCDTNWGGILCDQDLNYCGTHEPCQHGGTCENTAPDQYLCTCAEGFSGVDCERVDNPCAPQPCHRGACTLSADAPGFRCTCREGWTGPLCDQDIDECLSSPCQNGGTCRDGEARWSCECPPEWEGAACERDVDECAGGALGPCTNAARCDNAPGGFSCACLPGWEGATCARNVDDCASAPCRHGATCIDLVGDWHCACAPGWAGRTCAQDVDDCASRPCRHGGECQDLLDAYRCICPVGFGGENCELSSCVGRYCSDDRDHCAGAPCRNGAACYTAQSDYYCHCVPPYSGKNCTQRAREEPQCGACVHGACVGARCACQPGYAGDACDILIQECLINPCLNNGTCIEGVGDFTCVCPPDWTGKRCEASLSVGTEVAWCGGGGACANGGTCAGARCACAAGWAGARCTERCACPPPARCAPHPRHARPACLCPAPPDPRAQPCLLMIAGLGDAEISESYEYEMLGEGGEEGGELASWEACGRAAGGAAWWWGCNVCWCGGGGGARCTAAWCGLADCGAARLACRSDEVCVPAAPALCLRAPCRAPAECRRAAARRVEPPALPAPPACWARPPGAPAPPGCARARLELARERLSRGAHVERACATLRRATALALLPTATPLVLLCDLPPDDVDAIDLTLWVDPEEGEEGTHALATALRALSELAQRRLPRHPLLAAALRLRVPQGGAATPPPAPLATPAAPGAALPVALTALSLLALAGGAALAYWLRRRRARPPAPHACDEEKTNNLQNEENLRRYGNPLPGAAAGVGGGGAGGRAVPALALYKAHNADARNSAAPPPRDKPCAPRPLPPEALSVIV